MYIKSWISIILDVNVVECLVENCSYLQADKEFTLRCHFNITNFTLFANEMKAVATISNKNVYSEELENAFNLTLYRNGLYINPKNLTIEKSSEAIILYYKFISNLEPDKNWNCQEVFRCDVQSDLSGNVSQKKLLNYGGILTILFLFECDNNYLLIMF